MGIVGQRLGQLGSPSCGSRSPACSRACGPEPTRSPSRHSVRAWTCGRLWPSARGPSCASSMASSYCSAWPRICACVTRYCAVCRSKPDRLGAGLQGRGLLAQPRPAPGRTAIGPGRRRDRAVIACSRSARLSSSCLSRYVSARSTNGSAVTGSRMICTTCMLGLAGSVAGRERKQHAALGIRLAEDFAQRIGDQHRPDLRQLELLGHGGGRERLVQPDHDRRDLVVGDAHFDLVERLDRIEVDQRPFPLGDLLGRTPRLLQLRPGWSRPGVTPLKLAVPTSTVSEPCESGIGSSGSSGSCGSVPVG